LCCQSYFVTQTTPKTKLSREAELSALRRAIAVERRAYYADFQGRHSTFSRFMRQTADRLARRYPFEAIWPTIRGLFREYPNLDVGTRISIIKRAEELLTPIWAQSAEPDDQIRRAASQVGDDVGVNAAVTGDSTICVAATTNASTISNPSGSAKAPAAESTSAGRSTSDTGKATALGRPDGEAPSASGYGSLAHGSERKNVKSGKPVVTVANQNFTDIDSIAVKYVKGVGPKAEVILNRLEIFTAGDLLRHYPRRHLDFKNRLFIRDLKPGMEVTIFGTIRSIGAFQARRGNVSILSIIINDTTGNLSVTRFVGGKSNKYLLDRYRSQYPKGAQVLASGIVERDNYTNRFTLKNCELEVLGQGGEIAESGEIDKESMDSTHLHTGRLVPVYPLTEGLSLRHLRNIVFNDLQSYGHLIVDPLPEEYRTQLHLLPLAEAFEQIHFPKDSDNNESARRRLVFNELLAIQLQLAQRRYKFEAADSALTLRSAGENSLVTRLVASLPFKLTGAQERVFAEIAKDLSTPKPMHRLVQGDVGSGKTIVALMAFMVAIDNGFQGVMMAPTEILAEQHYRQFQRLITPLGLKTCLVVGKQGQKERRQVRQEILSGQIHIAVGTHALLEDDVEFKNLGLIIIDEQHRFGVKQRARLKLKSQAPELLTMTATPIPRTMALTIHGDLDVSEIDEMPPGRMPIETKFFRPSQKKQVIAAIEEQILRGHQAYIVFPLIDESESLSAKAATHEYEILRTGEFQHRRVGLMHGKLKSQEKEEVMDKFRQHDFDILVCTTVIEVGVDVPNACVMVIENADRFGLAQLHQLRGRVGRGAAQSQCFLISDSQADTTRDRLQILCETNDGFVVAEKDLEIRGPGEFLGYRQSGLPDLVLTDLVKDAKTLEEARHTAIAIIKQDPELILHPELKKFLERNQKSVDSEIVRSG
jgi:ATP-dependent DNA helicase RecG